LRAIPRFIVVSCSELVAFSILSNLDRSVTGVDTKEMGVHDETSTAFTSENKKIDASKSTWNAVLIRLRASLA
jgi:hypothetical protein